MSENTKTIQISWPHVVGGSVAAATAAALSTRLGLVGTIVGAAAASIVSALVAATIAGWLEHLRRVAVDREPARWQGFVVGTAAIALVAVAFNTGMDLVTSDLPSDAFATRLLAEMGLGARRSAPG
ncbi:hypothetical protein [Nocardioides sp. InS609-2]|uniref:hypothetical protein n=1 Tax=Nocardioides sp. InS609-2 TaxID=2760705 RepID=UPI0020BEBB4B|nr:hypothetical protein [Nocardioides sp. InS609-2]